MIIELPFAYQASYVPPRARNARDVTVIDRLPLNIRELNDTQFPIAARFSDRDMEFRWHQVDELRWDGRRFHRPYAAEHARERFYVPAAELVVRLQGYSAEQPFRPLQQMPDPNWHNREIKSHEEVIAAGRIESDDRRERIALLVEKAAGVVLCDGKIFAACGEPAWKVSQFGVITAKAILADRSDLDLFPCALARADRLEEYVELFWDRQTIETQGQIEVLMPQVLRLAPENGHLLATAADALQQMSGMLKVATREEFGVFADLRDALHATTDKEVTEEISDAVRSALDCQSDIMSAGTRRDLLKAYERWRKNLIRDVDLECYTAACPKGLEP